MLGDSKEKATARMKSIYFLKQFIVLAKIAYGLPAYSVSEADLNVIQCWQIIYIQTTRYSTIVGREWSETLLESF